MTSQKVQSGLSLNPSGTDITGLQITTGGGTLETYPLGIHSASPWPNPTGPWFIPFPIPSPVVPWL